MAKPISDDCHRITKRLAASFVDNEFYPRSKANPGNRSTNFAAAKAELIKAMKRDLQVVERLTEEEFFEFYPHNY